MKENTVRSLEKAARFFASDRVIEAEALYRDVLIRDPGHIQALNGMGALAMRQQRFDAALAFFHEAHKRLPANAEVIANIGTALYHLNQPDKAAICYHQALALDPAHTAALDGLGLTAMKQEHYEEAERHFLRAVESNSCYWLALLHLGDLYRKTEKIHQAVEYYERAHKVQRGAVAVLINMGAALSDVGKYEDALRWYRRVPPGDSHHLTASYNLTGALFALRRYDEMLEYIAALEREGMFSPKERSGLHVQACLVHYLRATMHDAGLHRAGAEPIKAAPETFPNAHVLKIYYSYLLKLLDCRVKRPELYTGNINTILYVLGESHCLSPAHMVVKARRCMPYLTSGVKAWHLAKERDNRYKELFNIALKAVPDNSEICVCYGEIDCRRDEGILTHYKKHPGIALEQSVAVLVKHYVDYVMAHAARKNLIVFFCGVPAIAKDVSDMTAQDRETLAFIVRHFNACLEREARTHAAGFVDVYRKTVTPSGFADGSCHIDSYHLTPPVVAEALKECFV